MEKLNNSSLLPEVWGGMECTINRVNDRFTDQFELNGFYDNNFIDRIIELNIKKIRFPVLWEKHQPEKDKPVCFKWVASQLKKITGAGIEPIAGLLHHGSGPAFTNLQDPDFPYLLAAYAAEVARAFPYIKYYTPVNEPLTTARFSGLYGIWYPHKKNDAAFIEMLLGQLKGTVLSMQAIREINPDAVLVQTEDLSKTYSTPLLAYQAEFENHRRWLSFDILCGKFTKEHPLWEYFERLGITAQTMQFFIDNPCPPGIMGINYYVTSERYLDENLPQYPPHTHGGNGIHQYADTEAVRVPDAQPAGPEALIKEMWQRYGLPLAITEVHLHCSREEQLRWFRFMYDTAASLIKQHIPVKGITAWALLGSSGWSNLLAGDHFEYETGAFDLSAGYPRITALGRYIQDLQNARENFDHIVRLPGWWQSAMPACITPHNIGLQGNRHPLLILGKTGTLGKAFATICRQRNIPYRLLGREELDVCNGNIPGILQHYKPWAVINATGYVDVDKAELQSKTCELVNSIGPLNLALACREANIKLLGFSSDLVFDGRKNSPYTETDCTNPLNVYGHTKLLAEKFMTTVYKDSLVIRTSAFFGPWDRYNFLTTSLSRLLCDETITVAADQVVSPTYVPHLVHACLNLLIDGEKGIWHLANKGSVSWYEFALKAAAHYHIEDDNIIPGYDTGTGAERPAYSVLGSTRYALMPTLEQAMDEYFYHKASPVLTH